MVVPKQDLQAECAAYSEHMNNLLRNDSSVTHLLPLDASCLIAHVADGLLLSHLLHTIRPGILPVAKLQKDIVLAQLVAREPGSKDIFRATENQNLFLEAAVKMGLKVVNVGAQDLIDGKEDLVLGVIWQLVRAHLLEGLNLMSHPELIRLMRPGETLQHLLELTSEALLLRWVNYHLVKAGSDREAGSFSESFKSGELYLLLMRQIAPELADESLVKGGLESPNPEIRAMAVLEVAEKLGCRKFVTAKDILAGNQRLNLAFAATLFNAHIGIRLPSEAEIAEMFARMTKLETHVASLQGELQGARRQLEEQQAEVARRRQLAEESSEAYETRLAQEADRSAALIAHVEQLQAQETFQRGQILTLQQEAAAQQEAFERMCGSQSSINDEIMRQLKQTQEQLVIAHRLKEEEAARGVQLAHKLSEQAAAAENLLIRSRSIGVKASLAFKERQKGQLDGILRMLIPEIEGKEYEAQLAAVKKGKEGDQGDREKEKEEELNQDLEMLRWLVGQVIGQKKGLGKKVLEQEGQLNRMRQMNDLMADKVKEIAEELNQKKTSKK